MCWIFLVMATVAGMINIATLEHWIYLIWYNGESPRDTSNLYSFNWNAKGIRGIKRSERHIISGRRCSSGTLCGAIGQFPSFVDFRWSYGVLVKRASCCWCHTQIKTFLFVYRQIVFSCNGLASAPPPCSYPTIRARVEGASTEA